MLDKDSSVNLSAAHVRIAEADGHWLAGFIEAEGSFGIRPNNGGSTRACVFSLNQRDDDRDLVAQLQDLTGLGVLRPLPAEGEARPQVAWTISRKHECLELVEILRTYPLRGRKASEFRLWAEAVEVWTDRSAHGPSRWERMEELSARLCSQRFYVEPGTVLPVDQLCAAVPREFLGGFVTGEGCLSLAADGTPRFEVKVRRDDTELLGALRFTSGLGRLSMGSAHGASRPTCSWRILRHSELAPLCALLHGVLRGRKARELAAWSLAASEYTDAARHGRRRDPSVLKVARGQLADARLYRPPAEVSVRRVGPTREEVAVRAIQCWADEHVGRLGCMAYDRWRAGAPQIPNRDTIARIFGSWAAALTACGLSDREASTKAQRKARKREP